MTTSVGGNIFQSPDLMSYTLVFVDLGPWTDGGGRPCHLVSIDAREAIWKSGQPDTVADGDREPIAHFGLSPFVEPQRIEQRCDANRPQGERRANERGADERRKGERRRPQRYVIRRAPN